MSYYVGKTVIYNSDKNSEREVSINSSKGGVKVSETLLVLKSGEIDITLPRTNTNIDIICNILEGMKESKNK